MGPHDLVRRIEVVGRRSQGGHSQPGRAPPPEVADAGGKHRRLGDQTRIEVAAVQLLGGVGRHIAQHGRQSHDDGRRQ